MLESGLLIQIICYNTGTSQGRPLQIEYAGAYYHVTSRGDERRAIFKYDTDREVFLKLLGNAVEDFHLRLHG